MHMFRYVWLVNLLLLFCFCLFLLLFVVVAVCLFVFVFCFVSHLGEPRCIRNTVVMCYELT